MDSDVSMSTDEDRPTSSQDQRMTRTATAKKEKMKSAVIVPPPRDDRPASSWKSARPKQEINSTLVLRHQTRSRSSQRSSRASSPDSGPQTDGTYRTRGRTDDNPGSSWTTSRKRERTEGGNGQGPSKAMRDRSPGATFDLAKIPTHDHYFYPKREKDFNDNHRHLDLSLSREDRSMVNNHYRSLQRAQNWNFYQRDTPVKDRTPFNGMAPDQRRAYDTRFLRGYDTVFDDCRLHRRAYICPFCPSHAYCFDTPDHNGIGIYHNSAQRVFEHIIEFHLPFQYFYSCHLCDETVSANQKIPDGKGGNVPLRFPHHHMTRDEISLHLRLVHINRDHLKNDAESLLDGIHNTPNAKLGPLVLNKFYIPPLFPTRVVPYQWDSPVLQFGPIRLNIKLFKDSPLNVAVQGPKALDNMLRMMTDGNYPRHVKHSSCQKPSYCVADRNERTSAIRKLKIDHSRMFRRTFDSRPIEEDEDALFYQLERAERLRVEADDIHTPYDEMVGPIGEIQDPVVPTDPTSTTGPLVTASTSDTRKVDLVSETPRRSSMMPPPRSLHPKSSQGAIPKTSTSTSSPAASSMVCPIADTAEDWNSEISEDPYPHSISSTWTEEERARMLRKKKFKGVKNFGIKPEDDPRSTKYEPPTGQVTSPAIEARMREQHITELVKDDERAVIKKRKDIQRQRPEPRQLPENVLGNATQRVTVPVPKTPTTPASQGSAPRWLRHPNDTASDEDQASPVARSPTEQMKLLREAMNITFDKNAKVNKEVEPSGTPSGFVSGIRLHRPLTLGLTNWPSQAAKFPLQPQLFTPIPQMENSSISVLSTPQNDAEMAFLVKILEPMRTRRLPNMVPLMSETRFGTNLHDSVKFHQDMSSDYIGYLRERRTNPTRAEYPKSCAGIQSINTIIDQVHALQCMSTNMHSNIASALDDFQKTVEWQTAQAVFAAGLLPASPDPKDQSELETLRKENKTLKKSVDELHRSRELVQQEVNTLINKMNRLKMLHTASQKASDQRAKQAESALTNQVELATRLLDIVKPLSTQDRYIALENAVEDVLLNTT